MTDRELLELAAKAVLGRSCIPNHAAQVVEKGWNPLEDEAEAFRLAIKLRMSVTRETARAIVTAGHESIRAPIVVDFLAEDMGEYLGTQRAIVLCAAEIGKGRA